MPRAIPETLRREIVRMCQLGQTPAEVSRKLGLGYPGVSKLWRMYRKLGEKALETGYSRCGRRDVYGEDIRKEIDKSLNSNEQLGAPIIRSRLLNGGKYSCIPHERTIQRWWKASGKNKPRGKQPKVNRSYRKEVHGSWQVDGKEKVTLADGEQVCYLSFTDEATCTFLSGRVFPLSTSDASGQC